MQPTSEQRPYKAFISYSHTADAKFAPRLQSALERLGQPWYRGRAFIIFRDTTNLAIAPELWPEIERALDVAEFFIYLASPEAAGSKWVAKEIDYWKSNKNVSKMLIVLTKGEIAWDDERADFDWNKTSSVPMLLSGAFASEPLYVDFSSHRREQLSLDDPEFLDHIATIAARLHQKGKDEIFGEHLRQRRKTMQLAWSAVATLAVLFIAALIATAIATWQYSLAEKGRLESDIAALRAKSETNYARAYHNEALMTRVQQQTVDERPDRDAYLDRIKTGASLFRERGDELWKTAYEKERQLKTRWEVDPVRDKVAETAVSRDTALFTLEVLDAGYGRARLVHYGTTETPRLMLIDGGDKYTFNELLGPRLQELKAKRSPNTALPIELAVVTQYDLDAVQGISALGRMLHKEEARGETQSFRINALWYNNFLPVGIGKNGNEPDSFYWKDALPLLARELDIPLNTPFDYFVMPSADGAARLTLGGNLTITVLGPDQRNIDGFYMAWERLDKKRNRLASSLVDQLDGAVAEGFSSPSIDILRAPPREHPRLGEQAVRESDMGAYSDQSTVNRAGIVLLIDFLGKSMLITSDARGDDILEGLFNAGLLSEDGTCNVDLLTVPHYGSLRNVTTDFFRRVKADHYIIAGNKRFNYPKIETLKMIADARGEDAYKIHLLIPEQIEMEFHRPLQQFINERKRFGGKLKVNVTSGGRHTLKVDLFNPMVY